MSTPPRGPSSFVAPVLTPEVVRDYAAHAGVCVRPLVRRVTDRETGAVSTVLIRCGSTHETTCGPCADRARRLRMQQCAAGWHLQDDPLTAHNEDQKEKPDEDEPDPDEASDDGESGRRVRSTRRRSDVVELPRVPQEQRTVGRVFTTPDGTSYRPSMFVTLTLGSYGKVIPGRKVKHVPGAGAPVNPSRYDYRRA